MGKPKPNSFRNILVRLQGYPKRFFCWLFVEPRIFWIKTLLVLVPLPFILCDGPTEPYFRYTGLYLQIMGIAAVVYEIYLTQKQFGQPGLWSTFETWLGSFPRLRKNVKLVAGAGSVRFSGNAAFVTVSRGDDKQATVDERFHIVHENFDMVRSEIKDLHNTISQKSQEQEKRINAERMERQGLGQSIRDELKEAHTSALHVTAMGAVCLFLGVTFATLSSEISSWLN